VGPVAATPFVAIGHGPGPIGVFWKGPSSRLWWASLSGSTWTKPRAIGGAMS
jgi:hypothetical protein